MKRILTLPGMFVVALCALGLSIAVAQVAPPPQLSERSIIAWDNPTTNVNGTPATVAEARVALFNAADVLVKYEDTDVAPGETSTQFDLTTFLAGVPEGPYTIQVRCRGSNGIWGTFSEPWAVDVNRAAPNAPTNVRVHVAVTVTVETP